MPEIQSITAKNNYLIICRLFLDSSLRHFNIILTISHLNILEKQMENACLTYIN